MRRQIMSCRLMVVLLIIMLGNRAAEKDHVLFVRTEESESLKQACRQTQPDRHRGFCLRRRKCINLHMILSRSSGRVAKCLRKDAVA